MSDQVPASSEPGSSHTWLHRMIAAETEELDVVYICERIEAIVDAEMDAEMRRQMRRRRSIVANIAPYLIVNDDDNQQPPAWYTPDV